MTISFVPRINFTKTVSVTPTISTSAYTSGDQVGGIMTIPDVVRQDNVGALAASNASSNGSGVAELHSVTILDGDKQDSAMDIWFFKVSPTVTSTDNAAFAMTKANQFAQCIGAVSVGATYSDAAAVSTSTDGGNIGKIMQVTGTSTTPNSIFAIAIIRAAATHTTTTSLQFQFSFYVD